jgi:uncharacterized coiled-coil protein SlyX
MTTISVDDLFDDIDTHAHGPIGGRGIAGHATNNWTNIQDPVRQALSGLTKAIQTHNKEILALDAKIHTTCKQTYDGLTQALADTEARVCSKDNALEMMRKIELKSDTTRVDKLEEKLSKITSTVKTLSEVVTQNANTLNNLCLRADKLSADVEELKHPNYDQIFAYIDRQVNAMSMDTDRKLALKADQQILDRVLPQRVEDIIRNFSVQLADVKIELGRTATKEDFHLLATSKVCCGRSLISFRELKCCVDVCLQADGEQVRDLAAEVSERVSRHDLQQSITQQVKPLVISVSSLERAMQIQQSNIASTNTGVQHQLDDAVTQLQAQTLLQQQQAHGLREELKTLVADEVAERVGVFAHTHGHAPLAAHTQPSLSLLVQSQLTAQAEALMGEVRNVADVRVHVIAELIAELNRC